MTDGTKQPIKITKLSTGYLRAQGSGPCEWAQWPEGGFDPQTAFFPEASDKFRKTLTEYMYSGANAARATGRTL